MKYLRVILIILLFSSCNGNKLLLEEYNLLFTDLENYNTYGYKSYYSSELNKAIPTINNSQGAFVHNGINHYIAISLNGYFKVKQDNNIGYTRNGHFNIIGNYENNDFENLNFYELSLNNGYTFFEPIIFPNNFLIHSERITFDGEVFVSIIKNNDIEELNIGKINVYEIPIEKLKYYKDGIYIINDINYEENISTEARIYSGILEHSNYNILAVLLRTDYVLSKLSNKQIKNIEYKKGLVKYLIEYVILTKDFNQWTIETFTPFLRYDY
jgi:flagellar basal body rod protein FlgF